MNVPLRVYALVVDLHVAGVLELLYPDNDRLRFGIAVKYARIQFRVSDGGRRGSCISNLLVLGAVGCA